MKPRNRHGTPPAGGLGDVSGMALLIVLSVISILIAAALQMNARTRSAVINAAFHRHRITGMAAASSAIHAAMALLVKDKEATETDTLQEPWADPEQIQKLTAQIPIEQASVTMTVTDEHSRIQVNALVRFPDANTSNDLQMFLWERFLENMRMGRKDLEDVEPRMIINSLKDWLDSGDDDAVTGISGAESAYYQRLNPPYRCKNGPMAHTGEMARVRGVTPDLFKGSDLHPGLETFVTVFGEGSAGRQETFFSGRVNINTAPLPVVSALLPPSLAGLAADIVAFRDEKGQKGFINDVSSANWFTGVAGFQALEGKDLLDYRSLVTTSSDCFAIEALARVNDVQTRIKAVVYRQLDTRNGKWRCRVASWEVL
jgi:general secretion pathway protein K